MFKLKKKKKKTKKHKKIKTFLPLNQKK